MSEVHRKSYSLKKREDFRVMNKKLRQQQDAWEKVYMSESRRGYNRSMGKVVKNPFHELSSFGRDFFGSGVRLESWSMKSRKIIKSKGSFPNDEAI